YILPALSNASVNNKATINAVTTAVNIIGNSQSGTYNATQQSVSGFTTNGLVGTDTASNITGFTASGATGTNAGSYANTVGGTNSNYSNIVYTNGSLNIGQATASISASKTYDSNTSLTTGQVSITGVNGQTLNYTGTAVANNANVAANATNYVSGITGLSDGTGLASNYVLPSQSANSANNKVTIGQAMLSAVVNANNKVYDGNLTDTGTVGLTGLLGNDVVSGSGLFNFTDANVGTGKTVSVTSISLGGTAAANYVIGNTATASANITGAPLTVTANASGKFYGQSDTAGYAGVSYNGFVTGQTSSVLGNPAISVTRSGQGTVETPGVYSNALTPSGAAVIGNYILTYVPGNYTITAPKVLQVNLGVNSVTYGTPGSATTITANPTVAYLDSNNNAIQNLSFQSKSVSGNVITYNYVDSFGKVVTFAVTGDGLQKSSSGNVQVGVYNYVESGTMVTQVALASQTADIIGTLDVNKASVTISANNASSVYNGTTQTQGVNSNGLIGGDNVIVSGAASARNVGTYLSSLGVSGTDTKDYNFTFVNAAQTITKANASVSGGTANVVYNAAAQTNTVNTNGFIAGDAISITGGASGTNAGTYNDTFRVSGADTGNYNINISNGALTIAQATANLNASKTYDGTNNLNAGQVTITGVNGQTLNYTGTASAHNANVSANGSNYVSGITGLSN
ncbi:beta strand repeat-containing protein, partial [Undibacterium sp. SXout20W]|uniref:beta strand repeat-containing protein n=1 Tax=Undibacterium sp. SXout20W TaxID=3413051 RepID=UPI003BF10727